MSVMGRNACFALSLTATLTLICFLSRLATGQDVNQHLRDQYLGKIFVLRGFPTEDRLHYDSSGASDNAAPGDWTTDGFVQVNDVHVSGDHLTIKAQRLVAVWLDGQCKLQPLERAKGSLARKEPVHIEIKADVGTHNPSPEQIDTVASKIFLTAQDSLGNLVPDYWKPCVNAGLKGTDKNCAFAPETLTIPGVAASKADGSETDASKSDLKGAAGDPFRLRKGVSAPRLIFNREPEFSDAARVAKFQGIVILSLVVNKAGAATEIHISRPLGLGLDAKAVEAVGNWKFAPSEKDGEPVPAQIAVEVSFHLY